VRLATNANSIISIEVAKEDELSAMQRRSRGGGGGGGQFNAQFSTFQSIEEYMQTNTGKYWWSTKQ
jgi:hypothetical protein